MGSWRRTCATLLVGGCIGVVLVRLPYGDVERAGAVLPEFLRNTFAQRPAYAATPVTRPSPTAPAAPTRVPTKVPPQLLSTPEEMARLMTLPPLIAFTQPFQIVSVEPTPWTNYVRVVYQSPQNVVAVQIAAMANESEAVDEANTWNSAFYQSGEQVQALARSPDPGVQLSVPLLLNKVWRTAPSTQMGGYAFTVQDSKAYAIVGTYYEYAYIGVVTTSLTGSRAFDDVYLKLTGLQSDIVRRIDLFNGVPGTPNEVPLGPLSGFRQPTPVAAATVPVPSPAASAPEQVVRNFYALVANHNFTQAAGLWSGRMLRAFPPAQNINQRFADTRSLYVSSIRVASEDDATGAATVDVDLIELTGSSTQPHHLTGTWLLVHSEAGWLMDQSNF